MDHGLECWSNIGRGPRFGAYQTVVRFDAIGTLYLYMDIYEIDVYSESSDGAIHTCLVKKLAYF